MASRSVPQILESIVRGETGTADALLPLVYDELRRLADRLLAAEPTGQTLQPTALVHEAYLRLAGPDPAADWRSRGYFFAAAAQAMRRILVENARRKAGPRRGGTRRRVDLQQLDLPANAPAHDLLELDEALGKLAAEDPVKAQLVELRFFAGMSVEQAAAALGIAPITAKRYWRYARAWLHRELAT